MLLPSRIRLLAARYPELIAVLAAVQRAPREQRTGEIAGH
jgi:hypothetical protein